MSTDIEIVNIHDAKTNLSRLVDLASKGHPFIIAKAGKPLVKVEAIDEKPRKRIGALKGLYPAVEDIDAPFADDIAKLFNGEAD
ncbi:type II toxin-antitoxin system Phd/YefM family antitoxin [Pseudomonas sp. Pseusp97]|uniref:type II toxin-antitoxin system Phd/YefM family antitoxin n=1 Tax=Pseudomonas sp. Pseusp97 TaxID=3243065 RepID=UPI0039A71781